MLIKRKYFRKWNAINRFISLSNIVSSKSEGRRMIEQNGISINGIKEKDVNRLITTTDFNNGELIIKKSI